MKVIRKSLLEGTKGASGIVVVIDVFRAFTCAPLFFHLGARRVILEADIDKAKDKKKHNPSFILIGEHNEVPIEGADSGNSPSEIIRMGPEIFKDSVVVHRTTAGVNGIFGVIDSAEKVIPGSYVMARAISEYIKEINPSSVTLIAMGERGIRRSPEDECCADYLEALLMDKDYDHIQALNRIVSSYSAQKFFDSHKPYLPPEDPIICLQRDILPIVLEAKKMNDCIELIKVI